jgi:L-iditol 2-dehydrogenase
MKHVVVTAKSQCGLEEIDEPRVAENYVKIKIHSAPLCTEFHQFLKGDPRPLGGHEAAGEVADIGPRVNMVKPGDRVVVMPQSGCGVCDLCTSGDHIYCQNKKDPKAICGNETGTATHAQYCVQQDWLLVPIPKDLSYDHASMACCGLGPGFNAMQAMQVVPTDTILISGLGPVGLGTAATALYRGARVLGLDMNPYRIDLAKKMGVETVIDPTSDSALEEVMDLTDGKGVAKSVECSSVEMAPDFLVKAAARRGHIATPGWGGPINAKEINGKGLTVHGCWHWNHQRDTQAMMGTIRGAKSLIDQLITHTFPFSQVQQALETRASNECGKMILHPWEN